MIKRMRNVTLVNDSAAHFTPLMLLVYRVALIAVRKNLEPSLVNLHNAIKHPRCERARGVHLDKHCLLHGNVDA